MKMRVLQYVAFIAFLQYKLILSERTLPKGAKVVERCPQPKNRTAWELASKRLQCTHSWKIPSKQSQVYHCLATSYLNEFVEFCGITAPIRQGFCPVVGINISPVPINCSTFSSGCPSEFYYSRDVYKYPACLDLYTSDRCFRFDSSCRTHQDNDEWYISLGIAISVLLALFAVLAALAALAGICSKLKSHLRRKKGSINDEEIGGEYQDESLSKDVNEKNQLEWQGTINCIEICTLNKIKFNEYCAKYFPRHKIRWHKKGDLRNLKKVCLIVPSGGNRIADNVLQTLEVLRPYIKDKIVMLIVMSFCLEMNRKDPPNILHEHQKPSSVDSFTNIIFDEEELFYPCILNEIASFDIKKFINF